MTETQSIRPDIPASEGNCNSCHEVTRILQTIAEGQIDSTNDLIPLVYNELRFIAACKLANERPGHTLQATALVHEAYLRLLYPKNHSWKNRRHFFGAAAEAMRRILIENARRKNALKRGGGIERGDIEIQDLAEEQQDIQILDLHEALLEFEKVDPEAAELVKLRHFAGLTMKQIARVLEVSPRTADNIWAFAKVWLYQWMQGGK